MKFKYVVILWATILLMYLCIHVRASYYYFVDDEYTIVNHSVETQELEEDMLTVEEPETIDVFEYVSESDLHLLAKTVYGEARGVGSTQEQAAVVWCILNRVDAEGYAAGNSIEYVVTYPNQFTGYSSSHPVEDEFYDLSVDVVTRWVREKSGEKDVGRVLPPDYLWFYGDYENNPDDAHNHFRNKFSSYDSSSIWDWSLQNPYDD